MAIREWQVQLETDDISGRTTAALYEVQEDGQLRFLDGETFGPFDTALDVLAFVTRHWAPRARLPLR